jgi:2,5-diamino-6-(ribosylamino)-4(3H)-pyrimidinone 5'-phosphate reductase
MLGLLSSLSTTTTSSEIGDFLDQVYSHSNFPSEPPTSTAEPIDLLACPGCNQRPFVTLTYAQSLDGKIAGADGQQLRLSGNQSMKMTHLLVLPLLPHLRTSELLTGSHPASVYAPDMME